jgi:transposase
MPSSRLERRRTEERYYTIKDVAARLQVSEKTVRNWIRQRTLRAVHGGQPDGPPAE